MENLFQNTCKVCSGNTFIHFVKQETNYFVCKRCALIQCFDVLPLPRIDYFDENNQPTRAPTPYTMVGLGRIFNYFSNVKTFLDFSTGFYGFKEVLNKLNFSCINIDTIKQLSSIESGSIDAIIMVESLPRIDQPLDLFKEFKRIWSKKGCMYVEGSFYEAQDPRSWPYCDAALGHIVIHSPGSIQSLAQFAGFITMNRLNENVFLFGSELEIQNAA